eukprot:9807-Heterococcus_DN1.PRE.1
MPRYRIRAVPKSLFVLCLTDDYCRCRCCAMQVAQKQEIYSILSSNAVDFTAKTPAYCKHSVSLQLLVCYDTAELGVLGDWRSDVAPTAATTATATAVAATAAAASTAAAATESDTVAHSTERARILAAVLTHFGSCSHVTADNYQRLLPLLSTLAQHVELCMYRLAERLTDYTDTTSIQLRLALLTTKFRHACDHKWGKRLRERAATAKRKRDAAAATALPAVTAVAAVAPAPAAATVVAVAAAAVAQRCWSSAACRALLDTSQAALQQQRQQQQFDSEEDDSGECCVDDYRDGDMSEPHTKDSAAVKSALPAAADSNTKASSSQYRPASMHTNSEACKTPVRAFTESGGTAVSATTALHTAAAASVSISATALATAPVYTTAAAAAAAAAPVPAAAAAAVAAVYAAAASAAADVEKLQLMHKIVQQCLDRSDSAELKLESISFLVQSAA